VQTELAASSVVDALRSEQLRLACALRWHRAVKPRRMALQQTGDGGCRRAVRPIGARAGPCTGPEAITSCVTLRKATDDLFVEESKGWAENHQVKGMATADVRFGRLALTHEPALALKISRAASPCARPPMASSLRSKKRWGKEEGAAPKTLHHRHTSSSAISGFIVGERNDGERTMALHRSRYMSPHTTLPQPGDQSPCLHCLSVPLAVLCVSACVLACADIFALTCLRVCVCLRGHSCTCVCVCVCGIIWVCVGVLCVD
jgi:hypothetical protein